VHRQPISLVPDGPPWYIPGMSDDRKKPIWPWIVALLVGLPVLYVASFGPACWISSRVPILKIPMRSLFTPLAKAAWFVPGSEPIISILRWGQYGETGDRVSYWIIMDAMPVSEYEGIVGRPHF
jgi:hypothetical protein